MKKVLILCGGNGTRWNNFRGTAKHLLEIEGEVLLERTYRQFSDYTEDIIIVAQGDLKIGDAVVYPPLLGNDGWNDLVKLWSSHYLWSDEKTVLVFGDVYFTDNAVERIMSNSDEIKFFLRNTRSSVTGKIYEEIFAIAFNGSFNKKILDFINQTIELPISRGGWALFTHLIKIPDLYVNIDDWTEDFDCAYDLIQWEKNRLIPSGNRERMVLDYATH